MLILLSEKRNKPKQKHPLYFLTVVTVDSFSPNPSSPQQLRTSAADRRCFSGWVCLVLPPAEPGVPLCGAGRNHALLQQGLDYWSTTVSFRTVERRAGAPHRDIANRICSLFSYNTGCFYCGSYLYTEGESYFSHTSHFVYFYCTSFQCKHLVKFVHVYVKWLLWAPSMRGNLYLANVKSVTVSHINSHLKVFFSKIILKLLCFFICVYRRYLNAYGA